MRSCVISPPQLCCSPVHRWGLPSCSSSAEGKRRDRQSQRSGRDQHTDSESRRGWRSHGKEGSLHVSCRLIVLKHQASNSFLCHQFTTSTCMHAHAYVATTVTAPHARLFCRMQCSMLHSAPSQCIGSSLHTSSCSQVCTNPSSKLTRHVACCNVAHLNADERTLRCTLACCQLAFK